MRTLAPVTLVALVALVVTAACGPSAKAPATKCTGPDVAGAAPLERLPFHGDGLDASCQAGPTLSEQPDRDTEVRAQIAGSFEDLANALSCAQVPETLDVDFSHEEVLVLDFTELVHIDGVFDDGGVLVAASAGAPCGKPAFERSLSVLERTGDLDAAVRECVQDTPCTPD